VPSNALVCPPQPCATHPLSSTFPTFPTTLNGALCLLFVLTSLMLPFSSSMSRPPASRAQTSTIRMKSSYAPSSSSHSTHDHRLTAFLSRQEFPICLMKWQDRDRHMKASNLQVVDEFRSFVRPSWRPILSSFCTELTGITQVCLVSRSTASRKLHGKLTHLKEQVDAAPPFPQVLKSVRAFLVKNGLIDNLTGKRLVRFCWCSDGPFDVRDFVVKQCFISKVCINLHCYIYMRRPRLPRFPCLNGSQVTSLMSVCPSCNGSTRHQPILPLPLAVL